MVAGGPGDHPLTDILLYDLKVYGNPYDDLIKEISKFVSKDKLYEMFTWFDNLSITEKQLKEFEKELIEKIRTLRGQAFENGWEV